MKNNIMKVWFDSSYLSSVNQLYIEQLYKLFLINPESIDNSWCIIFNKLFSIKNNSNESLIKIKNNKFNKYDYNVNNNKIINSLNIDINNFKIFKLINSFRCLGYENVNLDPLNLIKKEIIPELDLNFYNFTKVDLEKIYNFDFFSNYLNSSNLFDLHKVLKKIYCKNIGIEFMHIKNTKEINWIQNRFESIKGKIRFNSIEQINFLNELTSAEYFEQYLNIKFPGSKRFSLEGCDVLIPILKEVLRFSCVNGLKEIILGMAHRGRLNVLTNIFGKNSSDLFNEFSGKYKKYLGSGDVKYHQGFISNIKIGENILRLILLFNPSHLEIVSPVVMGFTKSHIDFFYSKYDFNKILPITIHGDAAICGQGVVQETLNMSKVPSYDVGGTLRIVINNQIGFTTSVQNNLRSTKYCTDIIKNIQSPILHVNADNIESVIFAVRLAIDYRNKFNKDIMINLVCYRRYGHNEVDDPSVTQPIMYKKIKNHPTSRQIYSTYLQNKNIISIDNADNFINFYRSSLDKGSCLVKEYYDTNINLNIFNNDDHKFNIKCFDVFTKKRLKKLANVISNIPIDIEIHPQVKKIFLNRKLMSNEKKFFDWGFAEILSYATLLDNGISVRLSGEDTARGTFFHRHAIIYDQNSNNSYIPLSNIKDNQGNFQIWNSVLSEEAVLAFEYGYSVANLNTLVVWEAQFGDFVNGAQIVIDQFISSGKQKWNQICNIVILLPHGYEGQGPEHSSARLERFLQLCAEDNMQICIPSTPSQMYHVLRRQIINNMLCPLIILTPKSLLRNPLAVSNINDFLNNKFETVLDDVNNLNFNFVKRVIFCSGKIYYDLLKECINSNLKTISIIRIEQLYPFPSIFLKSILKKYTHVKDYIWCQEEPKNQGAWFWIKDYILNIISINSTLNYIGRLSSASPSVGYFNIHQAQQEKIINTALNIK